MLEKLKENLKPDKWIYGLFVGYILILFLSNNLFGYICIDFIYFLIKIINICYIGFGIKIIYDIVKTRYVTWSMILIPYTAFLVAIFSKNQNIMYLMLVLLALRNVDLKKLLKYTLKVIFPMFVIVVILSLLNIIPDLTYNRGSLIRHSLGFFYPTDAIGYYLLIILMYCYTRREKSTYIELFVLEAFNIFLFAYTNGRLSFLLVTAILTIMLLYKVLHNKEKLRSIFFNTKTQKALKIMCYALPIIIFLFAIALTYLYGVGNNIAIKLNNLLSDRLRLNYEAFGRYPVKLFGSSIRWNGWGGYGYVIKEPIESYDYNFVDMSYIRIIFDYGIIGTILIIVGYTTILSKSYNEKDYWTILVLCFILLWAFVEPHIINIITNFLVVLLAPLLELARIKIKKS